METVSAQTDLQHEIESLPLVDTHEHLHKEDRWVGDGPDVLQDLFGNYAMSDLLVAGAPPDAVERLLDSSAGDLASRFLPVRDAWEAIQLTGYGEAVRLIAHEIYGLEELTVDGLEAAQVTLTSLRRPGERPSGARRLVPRTRGRTRGREQPAPQDPYRPSGRHRFDAGRSCAAESSLRAARAVPADAVRTDAHLLSVQRRAHLDREALPE